MKISTENSPIGKEKGQRIRVLFISHGSGPGGAELSLLGLLKGLDRDRFEPYVILPCAGKMRAPLEAMGVEVRAPPLEHWIPSSAIWGVGHWWRLMFRLRGRVAKLASIIREYRIDLVYTNTVTVIDGALAALVTRRPHVWHARERYSGNDDIKGYLPGWAIKHVILALSDRVIVNSNALAQAFATSGHRSKVTRIYNGVEVHAFESPGTSRVDLESQLGIPRSFVLLGMFGRLSERKDPMTMVRAVHQLRVGGMQVACLFVGQGDQGYVDHLRLVARDLGVDDLVFFAGQRSDVPALMGAIDILVLASKDEPFGRVLIEGMAAGKPVVATRSGGPEEIVVEGENGYLLPVGDHEAMADRLRYLALRPDLAARFGRAGQRRVNDLFRSETYVRNLEDAMSEVFRASARHTKDDR